MDSTYMLQLTALDKDSGQAICRTYFLESEQFDKMMLDLPSPFSTHEVAIDTLIAVSEEHEGEVRLVEES